MFTVIPIIRFRTYPGPIVRMRHKLSPRPFKVQDMPRSNSKNEA